MTSPASHNLLHATTPSRVLGVDADGVSSVVDELNHLPVVTELEMVVSGVRGDLGQHRADLRVTRLESLAQWTQMGRRKGE